MTAKSNTLTGIPTTFNIPVSIKVVIVDVNVRTMAFKVCACFFSYKCQNKAVC